MQVSCTLPINIYSDKDVPFCLKTGQRDCGDSSLCDPRHKHIITQDLQIIKNNKLRKLLTRSPNYRGPGTKNFSKALIKITTALDTCIESMTLKTKYVTSDVKPGNETV